MNRVDSAWRLRTHGEETGHRDIGQIEAIAREYGMRADERREFGDYVEDCKRAGVPGTGPNGDYTYAELRARAEEFRGGLA